MVDYFNGGLLCHSFLTIQSTMKLPNIGCALTISTTTTATKELGFDLIVIIDTA